MRRNPSILAAATAALTALAAALHGCSYVLALEVHNATGAPLVLAMADRRVKVADGAAGRVPLPAPSSDRDVLRVEAGRCEWAYRFTGRERPVRGTRMSDPVKVQVDADGVVWQMPVDATQVQPPAELASRQPQGFPLRPVATRCESPPDVTPGTLTEGPRSPLALAVFSTTAAGQPPEVDVFLRNLGGQPLDLRVRVARRPGDARCDDGSRLVASAEERSGERQSDGFGLRLPAGAVHVFRVATDPLPSTGAAAPCGMALQVREVSTGTVLRAGFLRPGDAPIVDPVLFATASRMPAYGVSERVPGGDLSVTWSTGRTGAWPLPTLTGCEEALALARSNDVPVEANDMPAGLGWQGIGVAALHRTGTALPRACALVLTPVPTVRPARPALVVPLAEGVTTVTVDDDPGRRGGASPPPAE